LAGENAGDRAGAKAPAGASEAARTFERRLDEARAFAAASAGLADRYPQFSARRGTTFVQRVVGWSTVIGALAFLYFDTSGALLAFSIVMAAMFGALFVIRLGAALAQRFRRSPPQLIQPDNTLPVITVLAPLYKEAAAVPRFIEAIRALDYPADRLDVKLLVEADDDRTLNAVIAARPPDWFEIIPVPPGEPRTKPKALVYGLHFARGDVVAVFDAEDRPAIDQPRAAIAAFRRGPQNLAVVQAPLQIHNGRDSWLAGQFALEYAIHFRVWLPFLAQLGLPLALGGTSNYFRRDHLEKVGGWDAWNVTEDADIGLRLARRGYAARMIAPPTLEEAPARLGPWLAQRTRWMKGHLQTWLVLNRRPFSAAGGMGIGRFLATQVTLGGALLASLMHAPLLVMLALGVFVFRNIEAWHVAVFATGYASVVLAALASGAAVSWRRLALMPVYWPLQSAAMLRALVEMKKKPHFWAKTPHGAGPTVSSARATSAPGDEAQGDNVVQLPLPF
jgi:cellulose synthase/poly-beta-1,6-N-acetylglucosamine synthase-like glycosyltransferase